MHSIHFASQIISYLKNNCTHRSRVSWVTWREITERIYEFDVDSSKINFYINRGKGISNKLKSKQGVLELLKNSERNSVIETVKLIELYLEIEKLKKEQLSYETNKKAWTHIKEYFNFNEEENKKISKQVTDWISSYQENKFHTELEIPSSLIPITLDYFLRWVALWIFTSGKLENLFEVRNDDGLLFIMNIIVICPFIVLFAIFRDRWIEKKSGSIFKELGIEKIKLKTLNTPWNYTLLVFYVFSGIFIMNACTTNAVPITVHILVGIIYGMYLLLILQLFSKKIPQPQYVLHQLEIKKRKGIKNELTSEENDEEIVDLEVGLRSSNERMEAFVLEAALFGALAFSGFLQIVSSGFISIDNMEKFTYTMINLLGDWVHFNFTGSETLLKFIMSKEGLLSLMCYETLFCSVFFLAVIASRLRFNDLTDSVDRALRLSESYNKKEDDLIRIQQLSESNSIVKRINQKIREQLRLGYLSQLHINPIMEYMKFFRTLGVTTFFIIIITGGLFISVHLSLVLMFISLVSMIYFRLDKISFFFQSARISIQEFYFKADKYVHTVSWGLIILAFVMRSFAIPFGSQVMALGFTFLFLHYLFSLFLPIELHESIRQKEDVKFSSNFQLFLQKTFRTGLAFFFLGFMFKAMHWPGAGPLYITGLLMLSFFFFFVKKLPNGPKWLGVLLTLSLGIVFIGILFKLQHWPGTGYFIYTFSVLLPMLACMVFYYRKFVRPMLQRTVYILAFLSIAMFSEFFAIGITNLSFNPERVARQFLENKMNRTFYKFYDDANNPNPKTKVQKDSLRAELVLFSEYIMQNKFDDWNALNSFAWEIYTLSNDTMALKEALKWAKRSIEIESNYQNLDTYAALLFKLGQYKEAEKAAIEAISKAKEEEEYFSETEKMLEKIRAKLTNQKELIPDSLQAVSDNSAI